MTTQDHDKRQHRQSNTTNRRIGWAFVVIQMTLIAAVVVSGPDNHWSVPAWLRVMSWALFGLGFAIMAIAALGLGLSLTATPVPKDSGQLKTKGLYRFSRHPIYTGLLAVLAAVTVRSGSWWTVAAALVTLGFFHTKARWEEEQLASRYPGYEAYAVQTPRFVPRVWPRGDSQDRA